MGLKLIVNVNVDSLDQETLRGLCQLAAFFRSGNVNIGTNKKEEKIKTVSEAADSDRPRVRDENGKLVLDSMGMPWDDRIHTASRKMRVKQGDWKPKRQIDPELVKQVESENLEMLKREGRQTVEKETIIDVGTKSNTAPVETPIEIIAPPVPKQESIPYEGKTDMRTITTFSQLLEALTSRDDIEPGDVIGALKTHGVDSMPELSAKPELINSVAETLGL